MKSSLSDLKFPLDKDRDHMYIIAKLHVLKDGMWLFWSDYLALHDIIIVLV